MRLMKPEYLSILLANILYPLVAIYAFQWPAALVILLYLVEIGITIFFSIFKAFFVQDPSLRNIFLSMFRLLFFSLGYIVFYAILLVMSLSIFEGEDLQVESGRELLRQSLVPLVIFLLVEMIIVIQFFRRREYYIYGQYGLGRILFKPHIKIMLTFLLFMLFSELKGNGPGQDYLFLWVLILGKIPIDMWIQTIESQKPQLEKKT